MYKDLGNLFRFMCFFEINRFRIYSVSDKKINAQVGWPDDGCVDYDEDEEVQDIEWDIQEIDNIQNALRIVDYVLDHNLKHSDKILVSEKELINICIKEFSWEELIAKTAISSLLRIRVDMIDDGEKSDYFFIHF